MKKIICRFAVAFAMLAVLLSCSEKVGTYTYECQFYGNLQDETSADLLLDYLNNACDGYFAKSHSYTGLPSETVEEAKAEFKVNCEALDNEAIETYYLAPGEQLVIELVEKGSGALLAYCGWANTTEVPEDDEH